MSANSYQNAAEPVEERVNDLLARMTLEEKVGQLTGVLSFDLLGATGLDEKRFEERLANGIGQISAGAMLSPDPARLVSMLNEVQRFLIERTRLGIPAIVHHEALAGLVHQACADFPTAINLAASWDPHSVEAMNDVVRRQMRALGVHQACSPNLDITRDARWGRVQESYGEDPYLSSAIGVAFVRGLQGDDRRSGVLATAKHFLGYGLADGGRNIGAVNLGERELLEVYARPFAAAIDEADLESVMCSYSDVNGEPAAASRRLLTDMLRVTLGFEGLTVADYGAVNALHARQHTAADIADAGVQALGAGLDVELPGSACYDAGIAAGGTRGSTRRGHRRSQRGPSAQREIPTRPLRKPVWRCGGVRCNDHRRGAAFSSDTGTPARHPLDRPIGQPRGCSAASTRPGAGRGDRAERVVDPQPIRGVLGRQRDRNVDEWGYGLARARA